MSESPKQSMADANDIEPEQRAQENQGERADNLCGIAIREVTTAINGLRDELASEQKTESTTEKKRRKREVATLWLLGVTFAAAGIGDIIFYCTMIDARNADRPYIWTTNDPDKITWMPIPNANGLGLVFWTYRFSNFGKGLAFDETFRDRIYLKGKFKQIYRDSPNWSAKVPMPPSKTDYTTAVSYEAITKKDFDQLSSMNDGIVLKATILYADAYGSSFETDICHAKLAGGPTKYCDGSRMK